MSDPKDSEPQIVGERGATAITRERAVSSRIGSILALGLMSTLGIGMLVWYYAHVATRQSVAQSAAQESARHRAQGDLPLPSLGPVVAPRPEVPSMKPAAATPVEAPLIPAALPALAQANGGISGELPPPAAASIPVKSAREQALERQLGGAPFTGPGITAPAATMAATGTGIPGRPGGLSESGVTSHDGGSLAAQLRPSTTTAVQAEILPTTQLLIPKGAFIDCTLETAIDSTLPGMTTCVTATDTFGVDGRVVLLERGTKLVGETRGQVQQGSARVFVLWDEARTPTGVVVPLASPGADELGRAGLPGQVNRHFWERFGAAMLISVLDSGVQASVQSSSRSGGVVVSPAASESVATEALKGTLSIPPSVQKAQGDRIQVMVARDLDFRSVYVLHADPVGALK